jgi:hypothetical protein
VDLPLKPTDAKGKPLRKGDRVRIVGLSDLSLMDAKSRSESEPVFRHLIGTCKRVTSFDRYGYAEIFFVIRNGPHRGIHSVAIEPYLLLRQGTVRGA